jgi:hypothetical protein
MFKLAASPTYTAPATHNQLTDSGALQVNKFNLQFKRLKHSELKALRVDVDAWTKEVMERFRQKLTQARLAAVDGEGAEDGPEIGLANAAGGIKDMVNRKVLERVLIGWGLIQDADGADMPFSMDAVDRFEEAFPGFINSCAMAFWRSIENPSEAAHKAATKN